MATLEQITCSPTPDRHLTSVTVKLREPIGAEMKTSVHKDGMSMNHLSWPVNLPPHLELASRAHLPSRFFDLFQMVSRKDEQGYALKVDVHGEHGPKGVEAGSLAAELESRCSINWSGRLV